MSELKFFLCTHCKNLVVKLNTVPVPMMCCGERMKELVANTVDAAAEKHVPVATVEGDLVSVEVGSVAHPMTEEHHISTIVLHTSAGFQVATLTAADEPKATFALAGATPIAAYEYCTLHGLWKVEL